MFDGSARRYIRPPAGLCPRIPTLRANSRTGRLDCRRASRVPNAPNTNNCQALAISLPISTRQGDFGILSANERAAIDQRDLGVCLVPFNVECPRSREFPPMQLAVLARFKALANRGPSTHHTKPIWSRSALIRFGAERLRLAARC